MRDPVKLYDQIKRYVYRIKKCNTVIGSADGTRGDNAGNVNNTSNFTYVEECLGKTSGQRGIMLEMMKDSLDFQEDYTQTKIGVQALQQITKKHEEIELSGLENAKASLDGMEYSINDNKFETRPEEINDIGNMFVTTMDNVLRANDKHAGGKNESVLAPTDWEAQIEPELLLNEGEKFLSPDERTDERIRFYEEKTKKYVNRLDESRIIGENGLRKSLEVSDATTSLLAPGSAPISIGDVDKKIDIASEKYTRSSMCNDTDIYKNYGNIKFPCKLFNKFVQDYDGFRVVRSQIEKNPFSWDKTADKIRSDVVTLKFQSLVNGIIQEVPMKDLEEDVVVSIKNKNEDNYSVDRKEYTISGSFSKFYVNQSDYEALIDNNTISNFDYFDKTETLSDKDIIVLELKSNSNIHEFEIYSTTNGLRPSVDSSKADINNYNNTYFETKISDFSAENSDNRTVSYFIKVHDHRWSLADNVVNVNGTVQNTADTMEIIRNPRITGRNDVIKWIFGVRTKYKSDQFGKVIKEVDDMDATADPSSLEELTYSLQTKVIRCQFWDDNLHIWSSDGCRIDMDDIENKPNFNYIDETVCLCNHLTAFGGGSQAIVNSIEFDSLFDDFSVLDNIVIILFVLVIFSSFIILAIYTRMKDKSDLVRWSICNLDDNLYGDHYFYQMRFITGGGMSRPCRSNLYFMICPDSGRDKIEGIKPRVRKLKAPNTESGLEPNTNYDFLLATKRSFGRISCLKIWHDNSGGPLSLEAITLTDLQMESNKATIAFTFNDVLSENDTVDATLVPLTDQDLKSFRYNFVSRIGVDMTDGHPWLGVFSRLERSTFTRLQRLTVAYTVLFLTFITGMMVYGGGDPEVKTVEVPNPNDTLSLQEYNTINQNVADTDQDVIFQIGQFKLTVNQVVKSLISTAIVLIPSVIITFLFKASKPKEGSNSLAKLVAEYQEDQEILFDPVDENDAMHATHSSVNYRLPWWCLYIGYALSAVTMCASGAFIFMYGVQWGQQKTTDWMISSLLSFGSNAFLVYPLRIVAVTAFMSYFCGRLADHNSHVDDKAADNLYDQWIYAELEDEEELTTFEQDRRNAQEKYAFEPPTREEIEQAKNKKTETRQIKDLTILRTFMNRVILDPLLRPMLSKHAF